MWMLKVRTGSRALFDPVSAGLAGQTRRAPALVPGLLPALLLSLLLLLGGCASLPAPPERPASYSLPAQAQASALARLAADQLPAGAPSGFRLLPLGSYALDARLALIRHASRSIDLQVYIMDNDESGRAVFAALLDAARRGVRVRLLLDDLNTTGAEPLIEALVGEPNLEIRLFNPFCCVRGNFAGRILSSLGDLPRLDHRMHNKVLIADGALAIFGGRNIANEYFGFNTTANFIDLDAVAAGNVVPQLAAIFDRYWNSDDAFPAAALSGPPMPPAARLAAIDTLLPPGASRFDLQLPTTDLLGRGPVGAELDAGRLSLLPAVAYAVADRPNKRQATPEELESTSLMAGAESNILGARSQVIVVSPYLVPGKQGMAILQSLQRKGVEDTLITNSLGANDSAVVYFGYARYRLPMLKAGVNLYEMSAMPSPSRSTIFGGSSRGRLHAKLVVIDEETTLLGSLNMDPRSARKNTEVGVAMDSPAIAKEALRIIDAMKTEAYRVRLGSEDKDGGVGGGGITWLAPRGGADDAPFDTEPGSSPLNALQELLLRPLIPEDQL
jgi:putative cardiolipin synthase